MEPSPRICAAVVDSDVAAIKSVVSLVDMYEVRIDLIGEGWREVAGVLKKPWIACNRRKEEGGNWQGSEDDRIIQLADAVELGAGIVDIELNTPGVKQIVGTMKTQVECLVSYHDVRGTPSTPALREIVRREADVGADICKLVTTARVVSDNISVLRLIRDFPGLKVTSFAMGQEGQVSRVLCPLVGGCFTYASIKKGSESAAGQMTINELREIYGMLGRL